MHTHNNILPFPTHPRGSRDEHRAAPSAEAQDHHQVIAFPEPEIRDATPEEMVAAAGSFLAAVEERLRLRVVK